MARMRAEADDFYGNATTPLLTKAEFKKQQENKLDFASQNFIDNRGTAKPLEELDADGREWVALQDLYEKEIRAGRKTKADLQKDPNYQRLLKANSTKGQGLFGGFIGDILSPVSSALSPVAKAGGSALGSIAEEAIAPVGGAVAAGIKSTVEAGQSAVKSVGGAALDVANHPYFKAALGVINPVYGTFLAAYEAASTGKITATQLATLGISSLSQFANIKIPADIAKGVKTAASIADGKDPLAALAGAYGAGFAKDLSLDKFFESGLDASLGEGVGAFASKYVDANQAAADLVGGKSAEEIFKGQVGTGVFEFAADQGLMQIGRTFGEDAEVSLTRALDPAKLAQDVIGGVDTGRLIANQFGDEIAGYIGADDTNMQALGFAGVETAVGLSQGKSSADALQDGAKEYYDRNGTLPDIGSLASLSGFESDSFGLDLGFDWDSFTDRIGIDIGGLTGSGLSLPDLSGLGINLGKFDFGGSKFKDLGLKLPEFGSLGINLDGVDFEGAKFGDLGLTLPELSLPEFSGLGNLGSANLDFKGVDFESLDINAGELPDYDIDFQDLNIGNIPFPNFLLATGLRDKQKKELEEEEENNLIAQQEIEC
jgi:hypothetical protein